MSQNKPHQLGPAIYHRAADGAEEATLARKADATQEHEQRGWEAYRKWLSTMSSRPASERAPLDPSIYSWKGYQNWADKVRQSWKPEEG